MQAPLNPEAPANAHIPRVMICGRKRLQGLPVPTTPSTRRKHRLMLRSLDVHKSIGITDVSALSALTQLQRLDRSGCKSITDVSALSALTQLRSLDLSKCRHITDMSAISALTQLHSLNLQHNATSRMYVRSALHYHSCVTFASATATSPMSAPFAH
jgi:hypothetical protein